jgi:hypothetical protein
MNRSNTETDSNLAATDEIPQEKAQSRRRFQSRRNRRDPATKEKLNPEAGSYLAAATRMPPE